MRIPKTGLAVLVAMAVIANAAHADIFGQVGALGFDVVTNTEDFESYAQFEDPGTPFSSPGGFDFDLDSGAFVIWGFDGVGFPTNSVYQNGGASAMTQISMTDGSDIPAIQFDVANGFGPADPQNVWVRTYNNGVATGFDFQFNSMAAPDTITIWSDGTAFDEIRVQAYNVDIGGDEAQYGAASIDNMMVGTPIPAPGVLALFGLAGLAARRRRR